MPTESLDLYTSISQGIRSLDNSQRKRLVVELKRLISPDDSKDLDALTGDIRDKRFRKGFSCPHCQHEKVIRYGTQRGRQRYRCSSCLKVFSDLTHTPLRGTHHPEKWLPYMECMIKGYSLRKCARVLEIALSTAFTWRHKILNALKRLDLEEFEGILEVDETYFLYSEKGNKDIEDRKPRKRGGSSKFRGLSKDQVCVVVARDRNKQTHARVACRGQISKAKAKTLLDEYVREVSTFCSDANGTWKIFAAEAGVPHVELNLKQKQRVKRRIYHIQNVNSFHSRLKGWIERFKGVATKFLDNYLAWFRFIESRSLEAMIGKKTDLLVEACLPVSPDTYVDIRGTQLGLP